MSQEVMTTLDVIEFITISTSVSDLCTRRGHRFDFNFQQKFQRKSKIICSCFHKINKRKKSVEGTSLETLEFQVIFVRKRVKNQIFDNLASFYSQLYKKTHLDFKFCKKILIIKENRFLVQIYTKIRSLCRFFYFMHFLEAFALKLHIPLEFLMEVEIKPASSSGAV